MSKILVTGGAGFIGSNLCEQLLKNGHEVFCVDNLSSGSSEKIQDCIQNPVFHFIEHDITVPIDLPVDQIYNLACPASPVQYQGDPVGTMKTCFDGAFNMLELARKNNARIIQASTSEIYGDPMVFPQNEMYRGNVNTLGARSCYDEGKRAAESLFYCYSRMHQVDIRIVRIFNTYGPKMAEDDGRVISNFIMQALTGKALTVYGDGSHTRSFCYVSDMVRALTAVMDHPKGDELVPVNIGNPHEITILELAGKILRMTGSRSEIVFREIPEDDPCRRCPDITKIRKYIDWSPEVSLEEGVRKTVEYFSRRIKQSERLSNRT